MERRDRLGQQVSSERIEAASCVSGRFLVVVDDGEVTDDLVQDVSEVSTSVCARLCGHRWVSSRAVRAGQCAAALVGSGPA